MNDCTVLNRAVQRYSWEFLFRNLTITHKTDVPLLSTVEIEIADEPAENLCDEYPQLDKDVNYEACKWIFFLNFLLTLTPGIRLLSSSEF